MSKYRSIEFILQKYNITGHTVKREPDGTWIFTPIDINAPQPENEEPKGVLHMHHKTKLTRLMFSSNDPGVWVKYAVDHNLTEFLYEMMYMHSSTIAARGIRFTASFPGHKI